MSAHVSTSRHGYRRSRARYRRRTRLIFALGISLAFVAPVPHGTWAQPSSEETNFTLEGKITEVQPGRLTVNTEGKIIFHVTHTEKTEIRHRDGSSGSAQDLKVGARVRVEGHLAESGEVVGQRIELE
jgi:hypothetical protein